VSGPANDFDEFLKRRKEASDAFVNGDFGPLGKVSVHDSPATLFGPSGSCIQGAAQVNRINAEGAARFESSSANTFEVLHKGASGQFAYWVGVQRTVARMAGKDESMPMALRVTELFRREDGEWKLFHRHADRLSEEHAGRSGTHPPAEDSHGRAR
jgi:ketosteroid isomerase-like protein